MARWARLLTVIGAICASSSVHADAADGASTARDFYLNLKARAVLALAGKASMGRTPAETSLGLELWNHSVPGLKLPFTAGLLGADDPIASTLRGDNNELDSQTFGGFGLFRAGDVYLKGKAGLAHRRIGIAGTTLVIDDDRTSMAVGVGAGVRLNKSRMELEYSWFNNANVISVGYVF